MEHYTGYARLWRGWGLCCGCGLSLPVCVSVCPDVESPDAEFYDLVSNPERYTGYAGQSAVNIWKLIYDQNCFKYDTRPYWHDNRLSGGIPFSQTLGVPLPLPYPTAPLSPPFFLPSPLEVGPLIELGGWGSAVSCPSGVRGRARAFLHNVCSKDGLL